MTPTVSGSGRDKPHHHHVKRTVRTPTITHAARAALLVCCACAQRRWCALHAVARVPKLNRDQGAMRPTDCLCPTAVPHLGPRTGGAKQTQFFQTKAAPKSATSPHTLRRPMCRLCMAMTHTTHAQAKYPTQWRACMERCSMQPIDVCSPSQEPVPSNLARACKSTSISHAGPRLLDSPRIDSEGLRVRAAGRGSWIGVFVTFDRPCVFGGLARKCGWRRPVRRRCACVLFRA